MTNRSREEIIAMMLESSLIPATKTAIMYNASLSYNQLKFYFKMLLEQGLISSSNGMWVVTENGKRYLDAYTTLKNILQPMSRQTSAL